jgi:hypothetical protein
VPRIIPAFQPGMARDVPVGLVYIPLIFGREMTEKWWCIDYNFFHSERRD